jgi:uncharacterized metal-binding protein
MSPKAMRKAYSLPVMRALDGSYRVGGQTDVYTIWFSTLENRLLCTCKAAANNADCSHRAAVQLHIARNASTVAQATESRIPHG